MGWSKGNSEEPCLNPKCCSKCSKCSGGEANIPTPRMPSPESNVGATGPGGTTYQKLLTVAGTSSDLTSSSGCLKLPLKSGGFLSFLWARLSRVPGYNPGFSAKMGTALEDGWAPAGTSAVFSFLPVMNLYDTVGGGRRRWSVNGTNNYSNSDVPDALVPYSATRGTTYWTEYDQVNLTYHEYFGGSSLSSSDPMFGRLNRVYDSNGNELSYSYSNNAGGIRLLRKITGFGGNVVPYFEYTDETVDSFHFAPITSVRLADVTNPANDRLVYFVYNVQLRNNYLTQIISPSGCSQQFGPVQPFDSVALYRIGSETDAEGFTSSFSYSGLNLTSTTEPEGRTISYQYGANSTTVTPLNKPATVFSYQTDPLGNIGFQDRKTEPLGRETTYTNDASMGRMTARRDPDGNVTYFAWTTTGANPYALVSETSKFNGAQTYYFYSPGTYILTSMTGPRNVPGAYRVATYYSYDASGKNTTAIIDALGNASLMAYDSAGRKTVTQDARGNVTYFNYNATTGNLDSQANADGGVAYFGYDFLRNLTAEVSPRWPEQGFTAFTTYHEYDQINRPTKTIDPQGNVTTMSWTGRGDLQAEVDALGTETEYTYNGLRLNTRRTVTDALGIGLADDQHGYDIYKNRIRSVDGLGRVTYYFYDVLDQQTATKDALQNLTYFYYDLRGKTSAVTDARNKTTYYFYDLLSRQTVSRDALGNAAYYFYDLANNRTHVVDPRNNTTYFFFDALDRVEAVRDALARPTYHFYDAVGNVSVIRDARANSTYHFYDGINRNSVLRDAQANSTYYFYDKSGNLVRTVDARLNETNRFYDTLDRLQSVRDAAGNAGYFFYDAVGNRTAVRNARGLTTYFTFDGLSRVLESQDPAYGYTTATYDLAGNVTSTQRGFVQQVPAYGQQPHGTSPYGGSSVVETTLFYDALNRPQSVVDPAGHATYFFYDAVSNRTHVRDPRGNTTYFTFDALNRVSAVRDALANQSDFFFDQVGSRTVARNPNLHSTYFGYDALNRLTRALDAMNGSTYFEFDAVGNAAKVIDPKKRETLTRYDSLNRADALRMPDAGSAYFFYDAVSNRVRELDPRGNTTYYGYDALNRAVRIQDMLGRTLYFEYDPVSNLSKYIDSEGASSAHTYDGANRRTQTTYTPAGNVVSWSLRSDPYYVYDLAGNLATMGDLWGLHTFKYDNDFRPTLHRFPYGQNVYFEYDQASNLTGTVYPAAAGKLNAVYDVLNRQTKVQSPSGLAAYFFYDAASNLTRKDLGNKSKYFVEYDLAERISKWKTSKANNGALSYFEYTRDAKGLITKSFRNHLATTYYEYDPNDRLVSELWRYNGVAEVYAFRYAYDSAGNRIRARIKNNAGAAANTYYFYDQANQLKVRGTNAVFASPTYYFYDKNGSVTAIKEPTRASYFAYNSAGLLARIRWGDASSTYFLYDGKLQRYGMQTGTTSMTTTYFLWDGPNLLQELNSNGTVKEEHTNIQTPIAGIGQLVETNRPGQAQAKLFPIMDPRGSITKWMQSDGNTVFAGREYDAFGNLLFRSETGTWPGRHGYQSSTWIEIFSNNLLQRLLVSPTREVEPPTGRFLQNEPLLARRPFAHYLYANQNPVNILDPLGMQEDRSGAFGTFRHFEREEREKRWLKPTTIEVIYDDPKGYLSDAEGKPSQKVFETFKKIVNDAIAKSDCPKKEIVWNFKPGKKPAKVGDMGDNSYTYFLSIAGESPKVDWLPLRPLGYSPPGKFQTELYMENILLDIKDNSPVRLGPDGNRILPDSSTYIANTLSHELTFHGIGGDTDYKYFGNVSETGKDLDLTRNQPVPEWIEKAGFLPPKSTSSFLDALKRGGKSFELPK
jgi:YD repeat-containing protein